MDYNRAVMKQEVKLAMRQTRPHPMLVTLLYLVLLAAVSGAISWSMNTLFSGAGSVDISMDELLNWIMAEGLDYILDYFPPELLVQAMAQTALVSALVSILTTIWTGLMNVGYAGYCLDMSRNNNPPLGQIFSGFSRAGSAILSYILVAVFTFLWSMLFGIGAGVLMGIAFVLADMIEALALLLIFAAPVLYAAAMIWVVFRYAMVPYAIIDSQTAPSALDAIRTSKALMKGRKGSYFVLQLSFIGWYLLEYLVVAVGFIVAVIAFAGTASGYMDQLDEMMSYIDAYGYDLFLAMVANDYYDITWLTDMFSQMAVFLLPIALLCGVAIGVINLWLTPYRTGSNARFYIYANGGQLNQPSLRSGQSGQPDPYGGQPGTYNSQSGSYGSQPSPYGNQPGPYGSQSGSYGSQPGPYGSQPGPYGSQPGPYGGQPGPYSSGPYGYTPPAQSPFGGYPQRAQPPQYGGDPYPQWGAPQAPQVPTPPAAEPFAAPAAPAATETPAAPEFAAGRPVFPEAPAVPVAPIVPEASVVPEAPVVPETPVVPEAPIVPEAPVIPATVVIPETTVVPEPFVPTRLAEPIDDDPPEKPETPNDDTPQRPSGPIYPQY